MTDKNDGVLDPLKCAVHCVREHRGPVRATEMEQVVAKVAELLAADEALDRIDAELPCTPDQMPDPMTYLKRRADAQARRAAAIRACRGDS